MKFIVWLIRVLVFVLLLVLALSNTQTATLNFLAGYAWSAPLILIGLAFFVVSLLAGPGVGGTGVGPAVRLEATAVSSAQLRVALRGSGGGRNPAALPPG